MSSIGSLWALASHFFSVFYLELASSGATSMLTLSNGEDPGHRIGWLLLCQWHKTFKSTWPCKGAGQGQDVRTGNLAYVLHCLKPGTGHTSCLLFFPIFISSLTSDPLSGTLQPHLGGLQLSPILFHCSLCSTLQHLTYTYKVVRSAHILKCP